MDTSPLKILNHFDNIQSWVTKGEAIPINVQICPYDSQCNHGCPMCVAGHKDFTGAVMKLPTYFDLVDDLHDMGVKSITFTGGSEPTMHPQFAEMIYENGPDAGLITNGSQITPELALRILMRLKWVRVSLDASTPEQFRRTHGKGPDAFATVIEGIRTLVNTKVKLQQGGEHARDLATIGLGYLTYAAKPCVNDIVPAAQLALDLGVDYLQYRPMLKAPRGREIHTILPATLGNGNGHKTAVGQPEVVAAIHAACLLATPRTRIVAAFTKYDQLAAGSITAYKKCHFVHFTPAISASGNVTFCCHHFEHDNFIMGNINEQRFSAIWAGERKHSMVNNLPLHECPLLCRGSGFNEVLESCVTPGMHSQFI